MYMHETLPRRLRVLRASAGWGLVEAADRIGIDYHTLRDIEHGRRTPRKKTLGKIASAYGTDLESLQRAKATEGEPVAEPLPGRPYQPWLLEELTRSLEGMRADAFAHKDPRDSYIVANATLRIMREVLRIDAPGDSLEERVPEEQVEDRKRIAGWLWDTFQEAYGHYAENPEATPEETEHLRGEGAALRVLAGGLSEERDELHREVS